MNVDNIVISIIIPCYNDGKYIMDAIQSVEQYKGKNYEIIIVNDGSTDEYTLSILNELKQRGYFVLDQENFGLSTARNNAIRIAKGKYILPLDADNKIKPEYISKSIRILYENPETGVVYSDLEYFGEKEGAQNVADFDVSRLLVSNYIDACAVYRKKVWKEVGGYDPNLDGLFWEDWEFWLHAYKKGWRFYHIPEVLFYYRKKKDSLALRALIPEERKKADGYILFDKHSDMLYENYKKILQNSDLLENDNLNKKLSEKDSIIREQEGVIREKNNLIQDNSIMINSLKNQMDSIQHSITWRMMRKLNKIVECFFPLGSKRRKNYDLALIGMQVLLCDGWKSFLMRLKAYRLYCKGVLPKGSKCYFQRIEEESVHNVDTIDNEIKEFRYQPVISIIMPTWNTPIEILKAAVESVQNQIYPFWELCIADGNSNSETKQALVEFTQNDNRIKVKFLEENLNISENSNQAVSLATGEFIGLLDHDDELTFDALYEVVKLLQIHPEADLVYSDEDKIDEKGNRSSFFFKPDWSPDLLLSQNYISHFGVYRKSLIDKIHGFRIGYEGSQDYDLVLRFTEKTNQIFHIPRILYHWRTLPSSLALNIEAKEYAYDNAMRALSDAMERRSIPVEQIKEIRFHGHYRIKYKIRSNDKVSIIIPTKDNRKYLEKCINSIISKTEYQNYEILIVNNQSSDIKTLTYFNEISNSKNIQIIEYDNIFNYSAMNNFAVNFTCGKYLLFLNDDTKIISSEWMKSMLEYCQRDDVGAVGAKLLYADNTIQHAGVILCSSNLISHSHKFLPEKYPGYFTRPHIAQNISAVTGACLMVKKDHFIEVEGFDEKNLSIMFNDIDLCLKLREKKYLNLYTPFAKLYHYESISRGYEIKNALQKEADFFLEKWKEAIQHDPYYNLNLTQNKEDFSVR